MSNINESNIIAGITWGEVELEPEVRDWFEQLSGEERGHVAFYVDLLAGRGPLLSEPYTRQLSGKLRELRFYLSGRPTRVTYWIASGRRIILLTVFVKTRAREVGQVARAVEAMRVCVTERHVVEENQ